MEKKTQLGLSVLGAALALGALGNALLRATPWGINVLLWVAAAVLVVAVVARWRQVSLAGQGRWLVPLILFFAAALHRMLLYQSAYGLTELRLYVTAFMGWLAVVFLWFAATVLRGQRHRFAFGGLAAAFAAVALLNRLNPDAFVAQANVGRAQTVQRFDSRYVTSLSADAVPPLIEALPTLSNSHRREVARAILARWSPPPKRDWRTWNWGRWQARTAVESNTEMLRRLAGSSEMAKETNSE
jgi:hypothetical protein